MCGGDDCERCRANYFESDEGHDECEDEDEMPDVKL
jgi:hypothetical protein